MENVASGTSSLDRFLLLQRAVAVSLVIKASPVPAGAVEACSYEQDDQQGDEQAHANDGGDDGPDQRPLGHVDQGRPEGHPHPARPPAVLRGVPGQVDVLHAQGADQARPLVAQLVEGVFAVVAARSALTWEGVTSKFALLSFQMGKTAL